MTAKEAIELLKDFKAMTGQAVGEDIIEPIEQALTERDLYYQALCDIESGKDVRMILERVLT